MMKLFKGFGGSGESDIKTKVQANVQTRFNALKEKADAGDVHAMCDLGEMYEGGLGIPQNYVKSKELYEQAAAKDSGRGHRLLGVLYILGNGVEKDRAKGIDYYKTAKDLLLKARAAGDITASFDLGRMHHKGEGVDKNVKLARDYYAEAAEKGYVRGQYRLAHLLLDGEDDVQANPRDAHRWVIKASEADFPDAFSLLGWMYEKGIVVPEDSVKALENYERAAMLGNAYSQCKTGICYRDASGVKKNADKAWFWLEMSASQGDVDAATCLGFLYDDASYSKHQDRAVDWLKVAAEKGDKTAQNTMGYILEHGHGKIKPNDNEALKWYQKAAAQDYDWGLNNLALFYKNGKGGLNVDYIKAQGLLEKASRQGNATATYNLGELHYDAALGAFRSAASSGNKDAQAALARFGSAGSKNTGRNSAWDKDGVPFAVKAGRSAALSGAKH